MDTSKFDSNDPFFLLLKDVFYGEGLIQCLTIYDSMTLNEATASNNESNKVRPIENIVLIAYCQFNSHQ